MQAGDYENGNGGKRWVSRLTEEKYKVYRKYYKKILIEAEQSYFRKLFDTKTNSVKQLWKNLTTVASLGKQKSKCNINTVIYENENISDTKR